MPIVPVVENILFAEMQNSDYDYELTQATSPPSGEFQSLCNKTLHTSDVVAFIEHVTEGTVCEDCIKAMYVLSVEQAG